MSRTVISKGTENVYMKLTPKEWAARAEEIGRIGATIEDLDKKLDVAKGTAKALKEQVEAARAESTRMAKVIRERAEYRNEEVEHVADYTAGLVFTHVVSTGEVIHERQMTDSERQRPLPLKVTANR